MNFDKGKEKKKRKYFLKLKSKERKNVSIGISCNTSWEKLLSLSLSLSLSPWFDICVSWFCISTLLTPAKYLLCCFSLSSRPDPALFLSFLTHTHFSFFFYLFFSSSFFFSFFPSLSLPLFLPLFLSLPLLFLWSCFSENFIHKKGKHFLMRKLKASLNESSNDGLSCRQQLQKLRQPGRRQTNALLFISVCYILYYFCFSSIQFHCFSAIPNFLLFCRNFH